MKQETVLYLVVMIVTILTATLVSGCSSSNGGRFYCGFEETNGLTKTETYKTSEVKK